MKSIIVSHRYAHASSRLLFWLVEGRQLTLLLFFQLDALSSSRPPLVRIHHSFVTFSLCLSLSLSLSSFRTAFNNDNKQLTMNVKRLKESCVQSSVGGCHCTAYGRLTRRALIVGTCRICFFASLFIKDVGTYTALHCVQWPQRLQQPHQFKSDRYFSIAPHHDNILFYFILLVFTELCIDGYHKEIIYAFTRVEMMKVISQHSSQIVGGGGGGSLTLLNNDKRSTHKYIYNNKQ